MNAGAVPQAPQAESQADSSFKSESLSRRSIEQGLPARDYRNEQSVLSDALVRKRQRTTALRQEPEERNQNQHMTASAVSQAPQAGNYAASTAKFGPLSYTAIKQQELPARYTQRLLSDASVRKRPRIAASRQESVENAVEAQSSAAAARDKAIPTITREEAQKQNGPITGEEQAVLQQVREDTGRLNNQENETSLSKVL